MYNNIDMKFFVHNNIRWFNVVKKFKEQGTDYVLLEGTKDGRAQFMKVKKSWVDEQQQKKPVKKYSIDSFDKTLANLQHDLLKFDIEESEQKHKKLIETRNNTFVRASQGDILNAGNYIINFDLKIIIVIDDRARFYNDFISKSVTVSRPTDIDKIIDKIIDDHIGEFYNFVSGVDWEAKNIKYARQQRLDLGNVKLRGTKLAYNLLGDLKNININEGQCVLDYILYETCNKDKFKKLTREDLLKFFGTKCIESGITTNQIINWAKHMGNVSVHALNPFLVEFKSHVVRDAKLSLCFIVNNNHCYPIIDTTMKKSIAENECLAISNLLYKVSFDDCEYFEKTSKSLVWGTASSKKVVLIGVNNLLELVQRIGKVTKHIVLHMKFNKSRVTMFEHPISKQVYVTSEDYNERKKVSEDMLKETNVYNFNFNNQSWTQLSKSYSKYLTGELPKSDYSNDLLNIIKNYKVSPYIAKVNGNYNEDDLEAFDIKRCYTSVLIDNQVDYNVFSIFDNVTPFLETDEMQAGEYYINRNICMADNTIVLSRGFYPLVIVKYWLENNYINKKDITHKIYSSFSLKADSFKSFANNCYTKWPKESKYLVNNFVGDLNTFNKTKSKGCVTDSLEIAIGTYFNEKVKGCTPAIYHVNDLYFLRLDEVKELNSGNIPIWRHIIVSAYMKLDYLYKSVVGANTKVICYNTDCIKVVRPKEFELIESDKAGSIRYDTSLFVKGLPISELPKHDEFKYIDPSWNIFTETADNYEELLTFVKSNNCLVTGQGGTGKTEVIKKTFGNKDICFTFTHKACENLKNRGVENVFVFDCYFISETKGGTYNEKTFSGIKNIYVDEIMCVPSKWIKKLVDIKRKYPHIQFKLFGDSKQTEPIEEMGKQYNYNVNPTIMNLVNFNRVEMMYKFTRYDKTLYDVIMYFDKYNRLPTSCNNKKVKECYTNLCYTNETRKRINNECLERFTANNNVDVIQFNNFNVFVGCPIICLWNNPLRGLFNSRVFKVTSIENDTITLDNIKVKKHEFTNKHFDYAFCMTVHKFQGSEITDDFCIYEIEKMDKKLLNTALTRGKSLNQVHFNYTKKIFRERIYKSTPVSLTVKPSYFTARIYLMTNNNNQAYVGSTKKSIEQRYNEHVETPVNKNMEAFMKSKPIINQVCEYVFFTDKDLLTLEDKNIALYEQQYNLMNVKKNIKEAKKRITFNQTIEVKQNAYLMNRFKIECVEKQKMYWIQFVDSDKKKKVKKAKWSRLTTKEQAFEKIKQVQFDLIKKYS